MDLGRLLRAVSLARTLEFGGWGKEEGEGEVALAELNVVRRVRSLQPSSAFRTRKRDGGAVAHAPLSALAAAAAAVAEAAPHSVSGDGLANWQTGKLANWRQS